MNAPYGGPPERAETAAPSVGELFGEVSKDLSELVRQELALAKAEATQTATRAGKGVGMFAGAAVAGYFVLLFLSVAGWWGLGDVIGRGWSALVLMLVWAIIAAVLVALGRTALAAAKGLPQTTDTVKRIPDALTPSRDEPSGGPTSPDYSPPPGYPPAPGYPPHSGPTQPAPGYPQGPGYPPAPGYPPQGPTRRDAAP